MSEEKKTGVNNVSEETETDEDNDVFRGIIIKDDGQNENRTCMTYPKGKPKIQARIKNGVVRLRCQGKIKTFSVPK